MTLWLWHRTSGAILPASRLSGNLGPHSPPDPITHHLIANVALDMFPHEQGSHLSTLAHILRLQQCPYLCFKNVDVLFQRDVLTHPHLAGHTPLSISSSHVGTLS